MSDTKIYDNKWKKINKKYYFINQKKKKLVSFTFKSQFILKYNKFKTKQKVLIQVQLFRIWFRMILFGLQILFFVIEKAIKIVLCNQTKPADLAIE